MAKSQEMTRWGLARTFGAQRVEIILIDLTALKNAQCVE
jgi:hypothetical protein